MPRHCERPGCTQPAEVIYGMSAAALSVWLEPYDEALASRVGVLCVRHADAMVVPRGWTLDDRREAERPLFRSPPVGESSQGETPPSERPKRARRRPSRSDDTGQLELVVVAAEEAQPEPGDPAGGQPALVEPPEATHAAARATEPQPTAVEHIDGDAGADADGTPFNAWRPRFDQTDDLDGLLKARSPLLARAFRGRGQQDAPASADRPDHRRASRARTDD